MEEGQKIESDIISYFDYLKENNYFYYTEGGDFPKSEIVVYTPYLNVLTNSWQAKRNYEPYPLEKAKNDALNLYNNFPLSIWFVVTARGLTRDFAQTMKAVIINADGSVIHPIGRDISPEVNYESDHWPFPYTSSCVWVFDSMLLGNRDKITFVLIRELGEQRAEIDFQKFK